MKKLILIIAALIVSTSVFAGRPTGFTPGGGAIMDWTKTATALSSETDCFWGYYIEAGYTYKFAKHSSLFASLRASEGFNTNATDIISGKASAGYLVSKFYLDIPIKYNFNFNVSPKVQLYVSAGPTIDFWLGYNAAVISKYQDKAKVESIDYFKDFKEGFNRVNIGLGGALGVFFHNVKIEVGYDQYLINPYKIDDLKGTRGQLRIGAAYVF